MTETTAPLTHPTEVPDTDAFPVEGSMRHIAAELGGTYTPLRTGARIDLGERGFILVSGGGADQMVAVYGEFAPNDIRCMLIGIQAALGIRDERAGTGTEAAS